jgi:hypothetical protein
MDLEMKKRFHEIRFIWFNNHTVENLIKTVSKNFNITWKRQETPGSGSGYMNIGGHLLRDQLLVKADSLSAYLSPVRAVLFQKKLETFTERDQNLRDIICELYPHNRRFPL